MFDVGFNEILFIALIALIILGPKRLPFVARTIGYWVSKARRTISEFKEEIDVEVRKSTIEEIAQLREDLKEHSISDLVGEIGAQYQSQASQGAQTTPAPTRKENNEKSTAKSAAADTKVPLTQPDVTKQNEAAAAVHSPAKKAAAASTKTHKSKSKSKTQT